MKFFRYIFLVMLLHGVHAICWSQIQANGWVGQEQMFTYVNPAEAGNVRWELSGNGTIVTSGGSMGSYFATILWDTPGTATLKVFGSTGTLGNSWVVNICDADKPLDVTDEWVYGGMGAVTLRAAARMPDSEIQWYDDTACQHKVGTGPAFQTPVLSTPTTYYARSVPFDGGCVSDTIQVKARFVNLISQANVVTDVIRTANVKNDADIDALDASGRSTQYTYLDGLGRPMQSIAVKASPSGMDVIQPMEYDAYGRRAKQYLPYTKSQTNGNLQQDYRTAQQEFYQRDNDGIADDSKPYATAVFENSPLGRMLEQGGVGADWQPEAGHHTQRLSYSFNDGSTGDVPGAVRLFNIDGTSTQFYPAGQLHRVVTTDEDGKSTIQFVNSQGNVIVRKVKADDATGYLETYYLYDAFDRVSFIIPPQGVAALKTNGWSLTAAIKNSYAYQFTYDDRSRIVEKKVPGKDWIYYVYDKFNRLVLVQDGAARPAKRWGFFKYDALDRLVVQGFYYGASATRSALQAIADKLYTASNSTYPETASFESVGTALYGYTNNSFPKIGSGNIALEILGVNYYDNYDFDRNGTDDFGYTAQNMPGEGVAVAASTLPTGSRYCVYGTTTWMFQYVFYDRYQRIIQTRSSNHLSAIIEDLTTTVYDFEGKRLQTRVSKKIGTGNVVVSDERYEYDATGRLKAVCRPVLTSNKVAWTNLVGASAKGNSVIKTSASTGQWTAGAFSSNRLSAGQDGWIEFRVTDNVTGKMMGLSFSDGGVNYTTINYAWQAAYDGAVYIWENGKNINRFGNYGATDVFSIERKNNVIYYKRNNILVYTSTVASTGDLYADCSMLTLGAELRDVTFYTQEEGNVLKYEYNELGQLIDKKLHNVAETSFLQSIDYRYTIDGKLSSINSASLGATAGINDDADSQGDYFGMEFLYSKVQSGLNNTAYFNGNVSAVKWKGIGASTGAADQRSYTYSYDNSDRLRSATYQANSGNTWNKEANANNESATYDYNGNIVSLQRNQRKYQSDGLQPSYVADQIDNLTYTYNTAGGDRLAGVEDASPSRAGFANGTTATSEYTYDTNGSITSDLNKGISQITYNYLGQTSQVTFTDGRKILYTYDALGTKLRTQNYQGNTLLMTTDYIGQFVYENSVLKYYGATEGRVVMNGSHIENQYAIADQQGNTRVVFTSETPDPVIKTGTFEGDYNDDGGEMNTDPTFVVSSVAGNTTPSGSHVVRMNRTYKVGPATSAAVYPGDKIDIEVWEYHESTGGWGTSGTPANTLITMVAGAFGGVSGAAGESGAIYSGVSSAIGMFQPGAGDVLTDDQPAAYLNYILFDRDYNVLDMGWQRSPATAMTRQRLSFNTLSIKEPGYLYVYLSYNDDSDNWVYFDDLKIVHTPTNVVQYNDYYPFGLQTSSSWTRENSGNNYLYNGGSELNTATGWYETFYRGYDPALGRFQQIDPKAELEHGIAVYQYAANNPVRFNDPLGDKKVPNQICDCFSISYSQAPFGPPKGGGSDWVSNISTVEENAARMSPREFNAYYGIKTDEDKVDFVTKNSMFSVNDPAKIAATVENNYEGYLNSYVDGDQVIVNWVYLFNFQKDYSRTGRYFDNDIDAYNFMNAISRKEEREVGMALLPDGKSFVYPWAKNEKWFKPKNVAYSYYIPGMIAAVHTHRGDTHVSGIENDLGISREYGVPIYAVGPTEVHWGIALRGSEPFSAPKPITSTLYLLNGLGVNIRDEAEALLNRQK